MISSKSIYGYQIFLQENCENSDKLGIVFYQVVPQTVYSYTQYIFKIVYSHYMHYFLKVS